MVYFAGLLLIGGIELGSSPAELENRFEMLFFESAIREELSLSPRNPVLYGLLGDLYQENKQYQKAIDNYNTALYLFPKNPTVQNNLAWLLATCPDHGLRHPKRALILAKGAAALDQSPHVLDTLAESYYVNGLYQQAVDIGQRALDICQDNRSYYETQLEKFNAAVKKSPSLR